MFGRRVKRFWFGIAVLLLTVGNAALVYADTAISDIKVTFLNQYDEEGKELLEPAVMAGSDGYQVESVAWSRERPEWEPGERITASIRLVPEEGRQFSYYYGTEQISVSGAGYLTSWRESDGKMFMRVEYYPVVQLGQTGYAGWSNSAQTRALWTAVPYATAYQLKLYRSSGEYVTTLTLRGTSVDLSGYFTQEDDYYYEVRATSKDSADAVYRKNGAYVTSLDASAEAEAVSDRWNQTSFGRRYIDENGTAAADGWRYIDGVWYYFEESGYVATGWRWLNGKWYYMDQDGRMQTGWLTLDDKRYYLDSTGAMAVGWYQMSPSVWYYFHEDGSMASDTEVDGVRVGKDGIME